MLHIKTMDYNKCQNIYDLVTLTEWKEKVPSVQLHFTDTGKRRVMCYDGESLMQWLKNDHNVFAKWIPDDLTKGMDLMGYGGGPDFDHLYIKLYTNEYIILDNNYDKLLALIVSGAVIAHLVYMETVRIGNLRGEFYIGDIHGQAPGYRIYQITGIETLPETISLEKYFMQFGIESIEKLIIKLTSESLYGEVLLGSITTPTKHIKLYGRQYATTYYVLSTSENDGNDDVIRLSIKHGVLTNIQLLNSLKLYKFIYSPYVGRHNTDDIEGTLEHIARQLTFDPMDDDNSSSDDELIEDNYGLKPEEVKQLKHILLPFRITTIQKFIEEFILVDDPNIDYKWKSAYIIDTRFGSKEMVIEKQVDIFKVRIVETTTKDITAYIAFEFRINNHRISNLRIYI